MAETDFWYAVAQIGADVSNQVSSQLGITAGYIHGDDTEITLVGFVKGMRITKELILQILSGSERIDFFFGAQDSTPTNFPPTDGVQVIRDRVNWTSPITGDVIPMIVEEVEDIASMGTMFRVKCFCPVGLQVGAVGIGR